MNERFVMLITGAAGGIGGATARLAAARGWSVCLGYRASAGAARALAAELRAGGGRAVAVRADVRRERQVIGLFDRCRATIGDPQVVINNAAVTGAAGRRLADTELATLRDIVDTNLLGVLLCAREAARRLQPGGQIINISSTATHMGSPNDWVDYAASKGAVDVLTRGLARELGPRGLRVNAVAPGLIDTALHAKAGEPDRPARYLGQIPLGRAGSPEEVARVILWLAEEAPEYLTGAVLPVSGGR